MSERISAVIYYDGEVRHTENGVVFLSENTTRLVFNLNIDLTELRKRIRRKIFGTMPMKVFSIKYQFCASVDPVTYDSFGIKGARGLEALVQTHLASGAPYLELYVQFTSPNDVFAASTSTAIREEYTASARHSVSSNTEYTTLARHSVSGWDIHLSESISDAGNTYWGTSTSTGWQAISNWGRYETSKRRDDVLPMRSIGKGTLYVAADEVALFSEPEPVPTEPEGDSSMLASLILPMVKEDPRTSVSVLISHICSQLRLRRHVFPQPDICVISNRGSGILSTIERQGSLWQRTHHLSYKGQIQGGHVWCRKVLQAINKSKARANTMYTVCHDRDNLWFRVIEFDTPNQGIIGGQYHVHLRNRTCDCGSFDALCYPCAHAIAACQNLCLDPMSYVDDVYKIEYMYNVWRHRTASRKPKG
ncbi:hypothetical protein J1N35_007806 [Gossypium stocksii]|uniref:SWIM-type domain-containing protein n=1 Tax=Gossypium stocksii TaxID=47602 RepID=A0A9D3W852_9ROSI|nr:hypothetical protein J1N35_007806 [Gossypium stocksii]